MIVIAIIRISKIRVRIHHVDIVWMIFWQQMEASMAVIMVSLSAFRSFFVARESRIRQNRHRHWYMSRKNQMAAAWRRKMFRSKSEETNQLPEIPRATMTGMSTFIREEGIENGHEQGDGAVAVAVAVAEHEDDVGREEFI